LFQKVINYLAVFSRDFCGVVGFELDPKICYFVKKTFKHQNASWTLGYTILYVANMIIQFYEKAFGFIHESSDHGELERGAF
jgi:hypothetical protein